MQAQSMQRLRGCAAFTLFALVLNSETPAATTIGGTDTIVLTDPAIYELEVSGQLMDIASDGTIYVAANVQSPTDGLQVHVYRSVDGGSSWSEWGSLIEPGVTYWSQGYQCRALDVVEGVVDRVYLACASIAAGNAVWETRVISSDSMLATASWSSATIHSTTDEAYRKWPLDLVTDVDDFQSFYVYVLLQDRVNGFNLWFTRSTNQGASFENIYLIGQAPTSDERFWFGDLDYGYGGYVHVSYTHTEYVGNSTRIEHRRASSYADLGLASWEMPTAVTAYEPVGAGPVQSSIAASRTDDSVIIVNDDEGGSSYSHLSLDRGASWPAGGIKSHPQATMTVRTVPSGFVAASYLSDGRVGIERCDAATPLSWQELEVFSDAPEANPAGAAHAAADPSHGDRIALLWTSHEPFSAPDHARFDAEWHADEGWPNPLPAGPVPLASPPSSSPLLVDLDGAPGSEIVFTTFDGQVQAFDSDGVSLQGWPASIGSTFDGGAAAAADLDSDGSPEIAVGDANGRVHLFRADGTPVPGWPVDLGLGTGDVYVSIGTVSRLSKYDIVACQGVWAFVLTFDGRIRASYNAMSGTAAVAPAALADLNGDLHDEIIVGLRTRVVFIDYVQDRLVRARSFGGKIVNGQPTVGDIDIDGDYEIVVPTQEGDVFVFDGISMVDHPGWPFSDPAAGPITSVALAHIWADYPLELAFCAQNQLVHLRTADGSSVPNWPRATGAGWFLRAMPIIEFVEGLSPDVIVGSRDSQGYAWNNIASGINGWPLALPDKVNFAPAAGDLDGDGQFEVAFVTDEWLEVVEMQIDDPHFTGEIRWPMAGQNARRSACQGCEPDVQTAVDEPGRQSVLFEAPTPNPTPGGTRFSYELPRAARVHLAIYDARGRRVRTLVDGMQDAGLHQLHWRGIDERDRRVAKGQYYARLQVDGGGVHTHKLTVLR